MNLKEAFRFQNKLKNLMQEIEIILMNDHNTMITENTYMRKKVMAEAQDETVMDTSSFEFVNSITELIQFQMLLMRERIKLSEAIQQTKATFKLDMDSEYSMNIVRRRIATLYRHLSDRRASEIIIRDGGTGYRFNAEGNQVSYHCDVKRVTKINFDRNVVRKFASELQKEADKVSDDLDHCLINSKVAYEPIFNVNDSFKEIFSAYLAEKETA